MFLEEYGVDPEAATDYAEQVLCRDRKMRRWLIGLRANTVEAVFLHVSLSQYESFRIYTGEYSTNDTNRIKEDLTMRPADFVAERDEELAWFHPRVRWVTE